MLDKIGIRDSSLEISDKENNNRPNHLLKLYLIDKEDEQKKNF
jgi:hypothetical protein